MSLPMFKWHGHKVEISAVVRSQFFDCNDGARELLPLLTAIVDNMTTEQQIKIAEKLGWSFVE